MVRFRKSKKRSLSSGLSFNLSLSGGTIGYVKTSVVIPAYNEEKRIGACIKSLQSQTVPPLEIIIVDNNSTDKTAKIAKKMGVTVLHEAIQGQSYARNKGFNTARGDIIARTDADTIVPPDWIEKIQNVFSKNNKLAAISGSAVFGNRILSPFIRLLVFEANKQIFGHVGLYGPNLALKKSVWEQIKEEVCMADGQIHEDTDLAIHCGRRGKIMYVSDLKVKTSARRLKSPSSLFVDYLIKWADTISRHKQYRLSAIPQRLLR